SPNAPPGFPTLASRDFWSLGASLLARRAGAEAGLLPVLGISVRTTGDFNEAMVRDWFPWEDSAVVFELSGADLLELLRSVHDQAAAEKAEQPIPGRQLRLAAGGLGDSDTVHGVPIEPALTYRVAASELLLANVEGHPALGRARNVTPLGDLREIVLSELRSLADSRPGPERYARLMGGAPVAETPLWKVNFRDISINASNTKVLKDSAFSRVPNSRVQGFDQQLIGMTAKIDADYLLRDFKWSNGFVLEYSQARLSPPDQPRVINTPNNRLSFLTTATRRVGSFPVHWLARSYGPSLGFQYEGEVEKNPGLKRKHIFYAYPGVEFFGGDVMKTVELSANFKRDYSRDVPNNQYGLRARALGSLPIHKGLMTLNGETWVNYFVRSRTDTDQDLGLEGDANFKLQIPIYQHLTLAPFIDFYYFRLKVRPLSGYSAITGLSLGFSRLWKPQYEKF
ncbi:MAG TPA: hypothetical protein VNI01_10845, partial [Elusimicrobiota bacterium]|nr:hypothetical protein [Elusimicrobiota bacterium]